MSTRGTSMNSFEATAHVVTQLEDLRIPYMLVAARMRHLGIRLTGTRLSGIAS